MKGYPAVIHQEDGKFTVLFPDIENCTAKAESFGDAMFNGRVALTRYLEYHTPKNQPSNLRQVKKEFPNDKVIMIKPWENDFFTPVLTIVICMVCLSMTTFAWYTLSKSSGTAVISAKITQSSVSVYKIIPSGSGDTEESVDYNNGFNLTAGFKYRVHITNTGGANSYHNTVSAIQNSVPYLIDTDAYGTEFDFFVVPVSDAIIDFSTKWGTSSTPELPSNKVLVIDNSLTVMDTYSTSEPTVDDPVNEPTPETDNQTTEPDNTMSDEPIVDNPVPDEPTTPDESTTEDSSTVDEPTTPDEPIVEPAISNDVDNQTTEPVVNDPETENQEQD